MFYLETTELEAAHHFAVEEYLLQQGNLNQPLSMLWQTVPTVMLGQYQLADAELDHQRAAEQDISIVRRSSGGGAIFTDAGTLLISLIIPSSIQQQGQQQAAREQFAELLTGALNQLGIPAQLQGRNDILVDGKKVSGMAQFARKQGVCTHGSLLFDADLELLARVLKVDDEKFRTKAVKSIRSRVTNVKEYAASQSLPLGDYDTAEFAQALTGALLKTDAAEQCHLSEDDRDKVRQIYQEKYGNPDWVRTKTPKFSMHAAKRFPAGKLEIFLDVSKGLVTSCAIHGDFLGTVPVAELEQRITGMPYLREEFAQALESVDNSSVLGGISAEEFLSCVFD